MGEQRFAKFGIDSMEATEAEFETAASVVFDQTDNRMHTIKAVLSLRWNPEMRVVVALGGNALLQRGEPMIAVAQHANVRMAAKAQEHAWKMVSEALGGSRRVVPWPDPLKILGLEAIKVLLGARPAVISRKETRPWADGVLFVPWQRDISTIKMATWKPVPLMMP